MIVDDKKIPGRIKKGANWKIIVDKDTTAVTPPIFDIMILNIPAE